MVEPLLGPGGHASADTRANCLVVVDTVENIHRIQNLLQEIDQPTDRLRVALRFRETPPPPPPDAESASEAAPPEKAGDPSVGEAAAVESAPRMTRQYVVTMDSGGSSVLTLHTNVPSRFFWAILARRNGLVARGVEFQRVDTGVEVHARQTGETVRLELVPVLDTVTLSGYDRHVRFSEDRIRMAVPLGEWTDVAGAKAGEGVPGALLDSVRQSRTAELDLQVRVDLF
jgi:hypothetical protein